MTFKKEICRNYYLSDTPVENIFIDEYMPHAPGEYVKVYIYAYMYSGLNEVMTNELIAKRLKINIEDVLAAWTYWETAGIIRKYYPNPEDQTHYDVEFINIKNAVNSAGSENIEKQRTPVSMGEALNDKELVSLYKEIESITGRMIDPSNALKLAEFVEEGADPSLISFAYRYCKENRKPMEYKFVAAIVRNWMENGKKTVKDAKEFIENTDSRFAEHRQIMKGLGLNYNSITEQERKTFNMWLDDMGYSVSSILEICSKAAGMNNKYSYVRKVLENEHDKKSGGPSRSQSRNTLNDRQKYYEQTRLDNQIKTKERRTEIYSKIPQISKIEEEVRTLGMEVGRIMLSKNQNRQEAVSIIKNKIKDRLAEKESLLMNSGYPADYMEDIYSCQRCKDTGILDDGGHCSCFNIAHEKM